MEITQSKIDQPKNESENESQTNTLLDYQLTRERYRKNRFSTTRINNDEFVNLYSELEYVNFEPTTFEEAINGKESKL